MIEGEDQIELPFVETFEQQAIGFDRNFDAHGGMGFLECAEDGGSQVSAKSPGSPKRTLPSSTAPRTERMASSLRSRMRFA
nr:hypothetical protein [Burkholderia sp. MSMB1589WGS]